MKKNLGFTLLFFFLINFDLLAIRFLSETQATTQTQWWQSVVCYEIYIRSFYDSTGNGEGDINGITKKLDYFQSLGIDVIWITPFYPSPNVDLGYDITDYKNVDPKFGTLKDLSNLIKETHNRKIKILLDMVFSHSSDQHPWFLEAKKSKNNPFHDYYIFEPAKPNNLPPNDWTSWFSGSAWEYNNATKEYYLHLFSKQQPYLNWKCPNVRKELQDVAKFWLDKGIDGIRFDTISLIVAPPITQKNPRWGEMPEVHNYLRELNKNVLSKYNILTVGEMPGVSYHNAWEYVAPNQKQLKTVFQLDIMSLGCKNGNKFDPEPFNFVKFKQIYQNWYDGLYGKGWNSIVLGNHDQARVVSRWGNDKQFRTESAKMLATFLLTQWGIPYIYQGDEIGMTNCPFTPKEFQDVEEINYYNEQITHGKKEADFLHGLLERCRDNARTPMQWNTTQNAGFSTAKQTWLKVNPNYKTINVAEEEKDSNSIFNYYKKMIIIRKSNLTFIYGKYKDIDPKNDKIFAYIRSDKNNSFLIICNFSDKKVDFNPEIKNLKSKNILIHNYPINPKFRNDTLNLQPYEAIVYKF